MNLLEKKCIPCSIGDIPLDSQQIQAYLQQLVGWSLEGGKLTKIYKFENFKEALDFTNRIGELAEDQGHHPIIHLSWGRVKVDQWTSKIKGLHENDFILAAKIDAL